MSSVRSNRASHRSRFPVTIRPTKVDIAVAREIARETGPAPEKLARVLTWGADEKVLLALAAAGWLASRGQGEQLRRAGNHAVLVAVAAALLPHEMKRLFDQIRPDRTTVLGHIHGVSFSGKREDAFPQATPCIWERWPQPPAPCPQAPAGWSVHSRLGCR
jgi:undecaprenyl-diphosphatase